MSKSEVWNRDVADSKQEKTPKKNRDVKEMAEYEKQRLSRIAENRKRMEALGLSKLATAFTNSAQKLTKIDRQGKQKKLGEDHDEDYNPSEDSSSAEDDDFEEEGDGDFGTGNVSESRPVKNKGSNTKRKASDKKSNNLVDEDDADALQQAIKLSLRDSAENSDAQAKGPLENVRSKNVKNQERAGMKRKGLFSSRMQMNEDEVIMNFYCFDESWKGSINVSDLKRVAGAHDFIWSDQELRDMIDCFDSDGDGKLSLDDFQRIAGRCNMLKESNT